MTPTETEIQAELTAEPMTVDAYYQDGRAIVLYKDTDGDYWTNSGYNEFCDDNETAQTIIWDGGEYHGSEDDGRTAFDKLVSSYTT